MARNFKQICEEAGYDVRSYSGRNMYGKYCLGIEVETGISAFQLGVELTTVVYEDPLTEDGQPDPEEVELLEKAARGFCQDSMGLDRIYYFTTIKWDESWGDPEDED